MDLESIWQAAQSLWLVWLMILFLGVVFWAFRPKNRKRFEDYGKIPFLDGENGG